MSAAEKLKAIENERVIRRAARLLVALPQIVAVVEAAEYQCKVFAEDTTVSLHSALAALLDALERK